MKAEVFEVVPLGMKTWVTTTFIDRLYFFLGIFTSLYLVLITFEFFSNWHLLHPTFELFLSALEEPYLAVLTIYVILKEIRKRHSHKHMVLYRNIHRGEYFVFMWMGLFLATTAALVFTPTYHFDLSYKLVISNSLASIIIYFGAKLEKKVKLH